MNVKNLDSLKYKRGLYTYLDLLIIEALGKYGPRNLNKIAKSLKIPESTVRYRIKKMIEKGLLFLSTSVYHTNIGLKKNLVIVDINPVFYEYMPKFLRSLGYWSYVRHVHGDHEGYYTLYIAPAKNVNEVRRFVRGMKKLDLIYNYNIYYSTCLYGVKPSTKWYDLKSNRWEFEWDTLKDSIENADTELPFNLKDPDGYPILADYMDIVILKELELDPTITYNELAEKLNTTPQNIYYHYHKHILKNNLIEGFEISFRKFNPNRSLVIYFITRFPSYDYFAKTANVFRELPIIHSMGKIIGSNGLFYVVYLPVEEVPRLFDTMNELVELGFIKDYEYRYAHYKDYAARQTLAYKKFKNGEWEFSFEEYMDELYQHYEEALRKIRINS